MTPGAARWLLLVCLVTACARAPLVVVAAGDISAPTVGQQAVTAALVEALRPQVVLVAGDLQYDDGSFEAFSTTYAQTWGRFRDKTRPAPGNHEYQSGGDGYFDYFGPLAGPDRRGWYAFDLGAWHFVSLNTGLGCADGSCGPGSEQLRWLEADLAANTRRCVIAWWHHPRFGSGLHGSFEAAQPFWALLAAHRVELVIVGHEHFYERFAPLDATGAPAPGGVVQLTVGTGGIGFSDFAPGPPATGSLVRQNHTFGVLKLTLGEDDWVAEFVPVPGGTFTDVTRGRCR